MSKYCVARSALVSHSAEEMFFLVNDIDAYPKFLPWCGGAEILARGDGSDGDEKEMTARVQIAYKQVRKSFTTRNRLQPPDKIIMELVDGPFSSLSGVWEFKPLRADACRISLDLRFDFANALTGAVIGPVFKHIADSMVDSFVRRADALRGEFAGDGDSNSDSNSDIIVEVVYALPQRQVVEQVTLNPATATLQHAINASTLPQQFPEVDWAKVTAGVFGTKRPADWKLADRDRVEIYRPLTISPTDARRRRADNAT